MRLRQLAWSLALAMTVMSAGGDAAGPENLVHLELEHGTVVIELLPEVAPLHAERIRELARAGFYDGVVFHRVIPGFMAQTGDPTGTGRGGSDLADLPAEFSDLPFERGTVGMARTADPNSANSQFFINFAPAPHLNGQYTVLGRVVEGMEAVDRIAPGQPPPRPDRIVRMRIAADLDGGG